MAFSPSAVATAIAALSVSGVSLKDLSAVPEVITQRSCPILIPNYEFVSNLVGNSRGLGLGGASVYSYEYDVNYLLYIAEIGAGRGPADYLQAVVQKAEAIVAAVQAADTSLGPHRVSLNGGVAVTTLRDPADKLSFFGASLSFHVWESA